MELIKNLIFILSYLPVILPIECDRCNEMSFAMPILRRKLVRSRLIDMSHWYRLRLVFVAIVLCERVILTFFVCGYEKIRG